MKYKSRSEFKQLSRSAFASAQKHGWLDEICIHMPRKKRPNGFWTKDLCVAEALKYQSRSEFQKKSSSVYGRAHKEGWLDDICSHMDIGKPNRRYSTKASCAAEAIKYQSRSEFKTCCGLAYNNARVNGWLDEICKHMPTKKSYNKLACSQEAKKYHSKKAFREGSPGFYQFAFKIGCLDEICGHMNLTRRPKGYWTKERCTDEAAKYSSLKEFEKKNSTAVRTCRKNGWLVEVCAHMSPRAMPSGFWTKERCKREALKYQSRTEFQRSCESGYSKARKSGWLDELCTHMREVIKPSGYWSCERCATEAQKYETRLQFQKGSEAAYSSARRNGWLDDICAHMMEFKKAKGYWTKDKCHEVAKTYDTRTDFNRGCNGAYKIALRKGWLDEICSHMIPIGNEYLRGLYLIINERLNKVYIGLTSNFSRREQEHGKGSRTNSSEIIGESDTKFIQLTDYLSVERAAELELQYVEVYLKKGYIVLNDRSRIGGLGGSRLKWTKELLLAEALKYNTRSEFQAENRKAYAAALRQGIIDEICCHMQKAPKKLKWTKDRLMEEARKYKSRVAFSKGSGGAYNSARKRGLLDEVCAHMFSGKPS